MIFSATSTHALRALSYLAAQESGVAVQGKDLARTVRVPAPYLAKILGTLARAGIVAATRGAGGGYRLAKRAERIRLGDVLVALEGPRARPGCLLRPDRPCTDATACAAHEAWGSLKGA